MKIAIITHSLRYNYGGILQNYALQQVLKQMGHEPCTVKVLRKDSFQTKLTNMLKRLLNLLHIGHHPVVTAADIDVISSETDKFINKHIVMSPRMADMDLGWIRNQDFDAIVVGSDQVLHPASSKNIEHVYLDFVHGPRKIMYAASFGSDSWQCTDAQTKKCRELLKDFNAISVRENAGRKMMMEHFYCESRVVLDPTLLLERRDYEKFCTHFTQGKYLAYYFLDPNDVKRTFAEKVASQLGLQVVEAGNPKMDIASESPMARKAPSVESWLSVLNDAEFVITDSYHGTLFSIIFEKQFLTLRNMKRGADRFTTILSKLGLTDRIISDVNLFNIVDSKERINFEKVNSVLSDERIKSKSFLQKTLIL